MKWRCWFQPPVQHSDRHLHRHGELRPIIDLIRVLYALVVGEFSPIGQRMVREELCEPVLKRALAPELPSLVARVPCRVGEIFAVFRWTWKTNKKETTARQNANRRHEFIVAAILNRYGS